MARSRDVDELLVLPRHIGLFRQAMQARAGHAAREMAPVRSDDRANFAMRAGGEDAGAVFDQPAAGSKNALPAFRRAGLDNEKDICGQPPQVVDQFWMPDGRQLAEDISETDQVARRNVGQRFGNIDFPPLDMGR